MRWPRPWLWDWPSSNWARCWPARAMELRPDVRWAVTYTNPLAARWSGTPLGVPLHPVQAYAALAFLTLSIFLLVWLPATAAAGRCGRAVACWATGVAVFLTEFWRDPEGRGALLGGALDGPQVAAIVLVLAGGLVLLERVDRLRAWYPTLAQKKAQGWGTASWIRS